MRAVAVSAIAITAVVSTNAQVASAAPGDVTSTTVTAPAALSGLSVSSTASSRDGGMYYGYTSGSDFKVFKTKPDGSQETAFGVNGIADVPGVTTSISGNRRLVITSGLNGRWWTSNVVNVIMGSPENSDIRIVGGGPIGAPDIDFVIPQATSWSTCASAYPDITGATKWNVQAVTPYPKRGGGMWMTWVCTGFVSGSTSGTENRQVLTSFSDKGVQGTAAPIGLMNSLGSTATCYSSNVVADPNGPAGTPELYVTRTEHSKMRTGFAGACDIQNGATGAEISGYSIVKIASDGSYTRAAIASAGDASDGYVTTKVDPGGRLVLVNPNVDDKSKLSIRRVKSDGTLDTSVGTAGITTVNVGAAPAGQAALSTQLAGIITTPTKVYLAIMLIDTTAATFSCNSSNSYTQGFRTVVASPTDGVLSSWGTAGVGGRTTQTFVEKDGCGKQTIGGWSVDTDGRARIVRLLGGTANLDRWEPPTGTNGGGDGGTGSGGPTTDTGGAASKGDGLQVSLPKQGGASGGTSSGVAGRIDSKVYAKAPAKVQVNSAVSVLKGSQADDLDLVTSTPKVCLALTTSIVFTGTGRCSVRIVDEETRRVIRTFSTTVTKADQTPGTVLTTDEPIMFRFVSSALSARARAQITALAAEASGAGRVLIVGHSASLFDNEPSNRRIALNRAVAVKAALQKAGVKAPMSIVSVGSADPVSTTKTEAEQAKNRRVEVFFFPAAG